MAVVACVTNIPSPYRLHQFELLGKALASRDAKLEVFFMSGTEPGRHWVLQTNEWTFSNRTLGGFHPSIAGITFHFNVRAISEVLATRPSCVILGGAWPLPTTVMLSTFFARYRPSIPLLLWLEATTSYTKYSRTGIGHWFRRSILSQYDAFVVPGRASREYVAELFGSKDVPCLELRNIVPEAVYRDTVDRLRGKRIELRQSLSIPVESRVLLLPARLIPEKGIAEYLSAIRQILSPSDRVLIAGEGPERAQVENWMRDNEVSQVTLLGHRDLSQMLSLYALSDVLLLPSLREPYGFVAVEGLWAGMPLLLSDRVGGHWETLVPGINGWVFDPTASEDVREQTRRALCVNPEQLAVMGMASRDLAGERFSSHLCVERFTDELFSAFPSIVR